MPNEDNALKMPVTFTSNGKHSSLIYPDNKGRLNIKYRHSFKLACTKSNFSSASLRNNGGEALVTCAGGNSLVYRGRTHEYADFKCNSIPKSELMVTGDVCQPENYTVVAVGFKTKYAFLTLYKVCFDKSTKNSIYTWYDPRLPYFNNHQKMKTRPAFAKTNALYGNTDVNTKYKVGEQVNIYYYYYIVPIYIIYNISILLCNIYIVRIYDRELL